MCTPVCKAQTPTILINQNRRKAEFMDLEKLELFTGQFYRVLMYEKEGKLKIGAEAYYYSPQKLNDGTIGNSYWTFGLMAEKPWSRFSIFVNLENITDTRQTKFDTIYTGSINNPVFRDIYALVDGFVINGGIKIKL